MAGAYKDAYRGTTLKSTSNSTSVTRLYLPVDPRIGLLRSDWTTAVGTQFVAMNGSLGGMEAVVVAQGTTTRKGGDSAGRTSETRELGSGSGSSSFYVDLDRLLPECPHPAEALGGGTAIGLGPNRRTLQFVGNTITRGTVVQLYGMAVRNSVSQNDGHHMSDDFHAGHGGFIDWGECYDGGLQPSMYNEFEGNSVLNSNGIRVATGGTSCSSRGRKGFDVDAPFVRGVVVRNTTLGGAVVPVLNRANKNLLAGDAASRGHPTRSGNRAEPSIMLPPTCGWVNATGATSGIVIEHVSLGDCPSGPGATGVYVDRSEVTNAVVRP